MVLEVGRRFVNGAWVTDVADESGGGGSQPAVTDGSTTVDPASTLQFDGLTVSDLGGGTAGIAAPTLAQVLDKSGDGDGGSISNVEITMANGATLNMSGGAISGASDVEITGELDITSGSVISDLTMDAGKTIILGSDIDISVGGAVFTGTDQTAVAVTAEAIHAALVNLGLITAP